MGLVFSESSLHTNQISLGNQVNYQLFLHIIESLDTKKTFISVHCFSFYQVCIKDHDLPVEVWKKLLINLFLYLDL